MLEPQGPPREIEQHNPPLKSSVKKKKKTTTRHWEAWTHDEEERFFLALRQVGKNFERITTEVESKNKDQVRHYYYRLIKRLNKLLSSEFTLDAKNSKDVNAAMLCWWSLLEKHKCSSIKLHLKPKRQKALVTALEQQLLRDRKKAKRKLTKGSSAPEAALTGVEPVITPLAPGTRKRSFRKTLPEPSAQQPSDVSNDMRVDDSPPLIELIVRPQYPEDPVGIPSGIITEPPLVFGVNAKPESELEPETETEPEPAPDGGQEMLRLSSKAPASDKIKLQLFPVDEPTRKALERDGHNPHLMLTLKGSKSINSVLQHLLQKWGGCSVASGELRLYPYTADARAGEIRSWSLRDAALCAAEVYDAVGKPAVFRLRYGWCPVSSSPNVFEARVQEEVQVREEQTLGCSWLYEKSTDGFGRRLWRDAVPSNDGNVSTLDWVENLTMNVSQLLHNPSPAKQAATAPELPPYSSIWGGEDTCDAFSFRRKEKLHQDAIILSKEKLAQSREKLQEVFVQSRCAGEILHAPQRDEDADVDLLGSSQVTSSSDMLRSSALDLYWADSLGALDGAAVQGQALLLSSNSSLGAGVSGSLFPDSLDAFPR